MELGLSFILKKWLGSLLMPLNVSLLLMLISLLYCLRKKPFRAAFFLIPALGVLLLTSNPWWVNERILHYERQIPVHRASLEQFDFVVVLGAGHISDPDLSATEQLSSASLARILKGIDLVKLNPNSRLIVSGYGGSDPQSNAELMEQVATQAQIPPASIITLPKPKNTAEEASLIATYIGSRPTALVTSALHMPRALSHFNAFTTAVVPVPTDFSAKAVQGRLKAYELLPDARFMYKFDALWHEKLGIWWQQIVTYFE